MKTAEVDVAPPDVDRLNCNEVESDGDDAMLPDCPADSVPAPLRHDSADDDQRRRRQGDVNEPCRPSTTRQLVCQCLPCSERDADTACGAGQVRVLVRDGLQVPGQCCDLYQCVDRCESFVL